MQDNDVYPDILYYQHPLWKLYLKVNDAYNAILIHGLYIVITYHKMNIVLIL